MKTLILFLTFGVLLASCKTDGTVSPASVTITGTWKVQSYIDNKNRDRTSTYTNYSFTFLADGSIKATSGAIQFSGTYKNVTDSGKEKFYITFITSNNDFAEINEDWILEVKNNNLMKLTTVSGGNGGSKVLIFER
jgi:hypothetical protein